MSVVVGFDVEHVDERGADHDLLDVVRAVPALTAATHWATGTGPPHVSLSVELVDGPGGDAVQQLVQRLGALAPRWSLAVGDESFGAPDLGAAAVSARDAHVERRSGRVVHFPGVEGLVAVGLREGPGFRGGLHV